ncbi:MAG: FAD-dependent oxidoreductase [Armatimonadota bacterium]|nr:FAD-dependent oxidoreductase [Armatimonadota bacterium]MDR7443017.1 FAD-dependent oxidoreductase [Armatimonadota bacterium]MDR7569379.1 FAD-dependent oxidoreductase [Armatimonadota bacterium]MDR7614528.1 FAD-dependent oxidoreductase [Armatimonadota bacterium]
MTTPPIVEVDRTWDVIVVGGGTAGAMAGIAAARMKARTLVVEAFGFLGGTATGALVTPMMRNTAGGANLNRGLTEELKARLRARGDAGISPDGNDNWFNPEGMKFVLEEMLLEAGGEVLYHTHFVHPEVEGGWVHGILVHNKGGLWRLRARVFVDATGDADLAARAGAPYAGGDEAGVHQAMTLRFHLGHVDLSRLHDFLVGIGMPQLGPRFLHLWMVWGRGSPLEPLFRRAVEEGVLLERDGDYFQAFSVPGRPGELSFNCPRIRSDLHDGTDPWQLSAAQVDGRRAIERLVAFCRRYLPGCEHAYVVMVAPMVGVRETRRIVGDYVLTLEDILQCRTFPDAICRNHYPVDIHPVRGERLRYEDRGEAPYFRPEAYHEIPYRCLIPRGLENVLVAGRCISATFEAQASIRIQQNAHAMGQAAGVAAALAALRGVGVREVDGRALRELLRQQGAYL